MGCCAAGVLARPVGWGREVWCGAVVLWWMGVVVIVECEAMLWAGRGV